jgi:endo-1,4-beta-mannosidase
VVERYRNYPQIVGWQVWNEQNMLENPENTVLEVADSPANYVEMLARAYSIAKSLAPGKLVLNGATTAVAQNYPDTMNYNKDMADAGATGFVDVWAIHYYGKQFENVVRGVRDALNDLGLPIWVTESGAQGVNSQLAYVEQAWPFLKEDVPAIERFYYYQYASSDPSDVTYGLRTPDPSFPVSDLYVYLSEQ